MISKIRFIRIKIYLVKFFIINYTQIFFYYVGVAKIDQKKYLHQFSCFSSLSVIMSEIMLILLMNSFGRLLPIISTKYLHFQIDNTPFTELNLFKNSDYKKKHSKGCPAQSPDLRHNRNICFILQRELKTLMKC